MTGFVSNPTPSAAPTTPAPATLPGDGFWPDLSLADLRAFTRLPTTVTDERVAEATRGALFAVARELAVWRVEREEAGFAKLELVPVQGMVSVGGEAVAVTLWRRAVHCYAAADLADTHHDIGATRDGQTRLEERASSADEHRRNALHAIRDLLGQPRVDVELI